MNRLDGASLRQRCGEQQIDWELADGTAPRWRHWGARFDGALAARADPLPPATLDGDPRLDLCPLEGSGWMQHPALLGYRPGVEGNSAWAPRWDQCRITRAEGALHVVLESSADALRWEQHWEAVAPGLAWKISSSLTNCGGSAYQLQWLAAATLPLGPGVSRVLRLGGPWAAEFKEGWDPLPAAMYRRDNRRGRSSHDLFPGLMLGGADLDEESGEGWAVHLGFSGSHSLLIEPLADGMRQLQAGELIHGGEQLLAPGQVYVAPPLYIAYSARGLAGLSAAFHATVRAQQNGGHAPQALLRPVHLNTWEAMYFDHSWDRLAQLARDAAQAGVERFVLDDGWFHGRANDRAGLGDWWPDRGKYPDGLAPLAALVNRLGMQFGLWVEPEMVSPDSDLYRAHPGWALTPGAGAPILGRHQLVLNLSLPAVADYLFEQLDALLRSAPIAYLKWDMNRDLGPAGAEGRAVHGAQVRALYRLFERLRSAHSALQIETCASGGGRADFGILHHTERVWPSDCNDALERIAIQRGFLRFFPPEVMGAHVGPAVAHTTGRRHRLAFRAAVALGGHLGVEADISTLPAQERALLADWIGQHKRLRELVHGSEVHQGVSGDGIVFVCYWQHQRQAGVLCVYRTRASAQRYSSPLRLPWLAQCGRMRVRPAPVNDTSLAPEWQQALSVTGSDGATLATIGLALPPMLPESAWLVELEAHTL